MDLHDDSFAQAAIDLRTGLVVDASCHIYNSDGIMDEWHPIYDGVGCFVLDRFQIVL